MRSAASGGVRHWTVDKNAAVRYLQVGGLLASIAMARHTSSGPERNPGSGEVVPSFLPFPVAIFVDLAV